MKPLKSRMAHINAAMDKWVMDYIRKQKYPRDKEVCTPIYLRDKLLIFGKSICGEWGRVDIPVPYNRGQRMERVCYAGSIHTHPRMPSKVCQELRGMNLSPRQIKAIDQLNLTVSPTDISTFLDAGTGNHYCYHLPSKTLSVARVRIRPDKAERQKIEDKIQAHAQEIVHPDNTTQDRLKILENLAGGAIRLEMLGPKNG